MHLTVTVLRSFNRIEIVLVMREMTQSANKFTELEEDFGEEGVRLQRR